MAPEAANGGSPANGGMPGNGAVGQTKPAMNLAARAGRWSAQHRKAAILGWFGFVAVAVLAGMMVSQNQISDVDRFNGESHRAEQALDRSGLRPTSEAVFIQSRNLDVADPEFRAAIQDAAGRLSKVPYVENVRSPSSNGSDVTPDRHAALVNFEIAGDSTETADRVDPMLDATAAVQARHPRLLVEQFGDASANKAVNKTVNDDLAKAGELSLPITLIILIFTFGSLVAAGIPLLLAITSVIAALALVAIPSQVFPIDNNLSAVILMIGLAVGVDYSLFYLRREREERAAGRAPRDSAAGRRRDLGTSGADLRPDRDGRDGRHVHQRGQDLHLIRDRDHAGRRHRDVRLADRAAGDAGLARRPRREGPHSLPRTQAPAGGGVPRSGRRSSTRVMRRPGLSLALAAGFLDRACDSRAPAEDRRHRRRRPASGPGDHQDLQPGQAGVPDRGRDRDGGRQGRQRALRRTAAGIDNLRRQLQASIYPPGPDVTYSKDGTVAKIDVPTPGTGTDAASMDALNAIRDEIIPATMGEVQGASVNVSGDAAASIDNRDQLNSRLPLIFAFVFGLAFLLMLVTFRSIVIPIKAILLNLLSVGAAYGVLVLVFQKGHGSSLLGFTSNGGVANWLPLFLFVILFGLSMDYHVFILSRVRELHERGMSTDEAVRQGITTTAGTVTSAAIVMVGVFSVFATLGFLDFKELGVGLAVAVLIDATIVRAILLPASMRLLGDWNWYLPKWLDWLPHLTSEGGPDLPPELEPPRDEQKPEPVPV